eukprot:scaffold405_cov132-Cylindrotheca_fusiformis.AAC.4
MATEAAKTLLKSAAPGQFDLVAENIHKLAHPEGTWLEEATADQNLLRCIDMADDSTHPLATSLKAKLKEYQEKTFAAKGVAARVVLQSNDDGCLQIHTYAEKLDSANQYTGFWKATWSFNNDSLSGDAHIRTCSYEDGNNQLTFEKSFESTSVEPTSPKDAPDEAPTIEQGIVDQILVWEHDVLDILASMHETSTSQLKRIRRVLPITKTKMKWDVVAHRSVKTLRENTAN